MKRYLVIFLSGLILPTILSCSSGGGDGGASSGGGNATNATFTTGTFSSATLNTTSVGSSGGTLSVSDASSPLNGITIVVPSGATDEDITFEVSYADISDNDGLPEGASQSSKMIKITTTGGEDWNRYRLFSKVVKVTLPYTAPTDLEEASVRFYFWNEEDGSLEPAGFESIDTTNNTITFYTRTFADISDDAGGEPTASISAGASTDALDGVKGIGIKSPSLTFSAYVAVGLTQSVIADWTNSATTVNTGFLPSNNGFYIPNYGSYYKESRGGNCFGMSGFSKWYFKKGFATGLYSNYKDSEPTETWLDDDAAIEVASRAHNAMIDIWNQFVSGELDEQQSASYEVALSLAGALYVTNTPAMLYIQQKTLDGAGNANYSGAHAIHAYRVDFNAAGDMTFHIYDPNWRGDNSRRITYTDGTGFANYASGTTAASSAFNYNYLKHLGYRVGITDAAMTNLKKAADLDFAGSSDFPTITITSITGKNDSDDVLASTGTTDEGQEKYITSDTSVIISGTVLGGKAQDACCVVNNLRVLTPSGNYSTAVNNSEGAGDGTFTITVPLLSGENMIALLAAKSNSYSWWAAFDQIIIDSEASVADMTITLSWSRDDSDIDLYVKEPSFTGKTGDTVYYQNREGTSATNPYLDFDNTTGYGPEHYIGEEGMSTLATDITPNPDGLYGDYTVKVHYYADHDSDEDTTQSVPWNVSWRYLAYCEAPCSDPETDGFWVEGAQSGVLSTASSGNCCNINNSGGDWSSSWTIPYDEPDPADWTVPESHEIMLP